METGVEVHQLRDCRSYARGGNATRLRKAGRVPAVVYGHKEATVAVTISRDELAAALRHHARTVDLVVDGKTETVLIQEVQHDHLGTGLMHVDFRRVSKDERVRTTVEIELRGRPRGDRRRGTRPAAAQDPRRVPGDRRSPSRSGCKIDGLLLGQAIHVKELELPAGVKALDDPDLVVVQVKMQQVAVAEPTALAPRRGGGRAGGHHQEEGEAGRGGGVTLPASR